MTNFTELVNELIPKSSSTGQGKKQTKKELADLQKAEAIKELLPMLKKANYTVYTKVVHVSHSGMMRHLDCFIISNGEIQNINWYVEKLGIAKRAKSYDAPNADSLRVSGCGMDMGFRTVYNLSSALYGFGKTCTFKCRGKGCTSNDHSNDRPPYHYEKDGKNIKGKMHSNGGYALKQRWL